MRSLSITGLLVLALSVGCAKDADQLTASSSDDAHMQRNSGRLIVLDPSSAVFVGTTAERAAGEYRFVMRSIPPAIARGDYVAGRQGGLFLGRVLAVSENGDELRLTLSRAAWGEVLRPYHIRVPFTPGAGSAQFTYGSIRWGPWKLVDRSGRPLATAGPFRTPSGGLVNPANFDPTSFGLADVDLCDLAGVGTCEISARLISSHFSIDGDVDHDVDVDEGDVFPPEAPSLKLELSVSQEMEASLEFELSGEGEIDVDIPLLVGFAREVGFDIPLLGSFSASVSVGLILNVSANAEGTIRQSLSISEEFSTGIEASTDDGVDLDFDADGHFDARTKVVEIGDVGLKVSVGPEVSTSIDIPGGDMSFSARADGFLQGTETRQGPPDNENWYVNTKAGTEAVLEGSIDIGLFNIDESRRRAFPGPGINLIELWGTGDLEVRTLTQGTDIFPGQIYTTQVARTQPDLEPPWERVLSGTLGINATKEFPGGNICHRFFGNASVQPPGAPSGPQDCDLVGTTHAVDLSSIAWNCAADETLPVTVQVRFRHPFDGNARLTRRTITVVCRSAFAVVRDRTDALFASGLIDFNVANALRVKLTAAEEARDAGNTTTAANVMSAFQNQVRAQLGKHIHLSVGPELADLAALLVQCYLTIVPTCSSVSPLAMQGS